MTKKYRRRKEAELSRCWVCGMVFPSIRCTAFCCSAACRKARSRFKATHGRLPTRDEMRAWYQINNRRETGRDHVQVEADQD